MTRDAIAIGILSGCGMALILLVLGPLFRGRRIAKGLAKFRNFHINATLELSQRNVLKVKGIFLVSSIKGWVAGELVVLGSVAAAFGCRLTPLETAAVAAGSIASGALLVILSLRGESRRQLDRTRNALPTAAFLYSLFLESGMGQHAAFGHVAGSLPSGPLAVQLQEIDRARAVGVSRAEAFERARTRVPIEDFHLFLDFIAQGERLGTGLSQALRELSGRMLEERGHRAETAAQKAAVKLLAPLVLFIFPSVFLIVLSPVLLSVWEMFGK